MNDLITQLEAATGPSFTLEQEIFRALNPNATKLSIPNNYTASIDAALTLVPEGRSYELTGYTADEQAEFFIWDMDESGEGVAATAATPALAICITALKARNA